MKLATAILSGIVCIALCCGWIWIAPQGDRLWSDEMASFPVHTRYRQGGAYPFGECGGAATCRITAGGRIIIDQRAGLQRAGTAGPSVLVVGSSAAWGALASDQAHAWWALLPGRVTVRARGGMTAAWEAAQIRTLAPGYDRIVWLTGGNDLLLLDGLDVWLREARSLRAEFGARLVLVRQPTLTARTDAVGLEQLVRHRFQMQFHVADAEATQVALADVDARRIDAPMVDPWHFGDDGHRMLAREVEGHL